MSKHTPGPWTLEEVGGKCKHLCPAKDGVSVLTVAVEYDEDFEGTYFGAVYSSDDARLIAAAPDMYEALSRLVDRICAENTDGVKTPHSIAVCVAIRIARAALAKADGNG